MTHELEGSACARRGGAASSAPVRIRTGADYDALLDRGPEIASTISTLVAAYREQPDRLLRCIMGARHVRAGARMVETVAIYYTRLGIGGGERVTRDLIVRWTDMGYKVILFTDEEPAEDDYELPVGIVRIVLPPAASGEDGYLERARCLQESAKIHGVDAFVYAEWLAPCLPWDVLLLKALDIPVIIHTHGVFNILFSEPFDSYRILPFAYRFADGIVCLSDIDGRFWKGFCPRTYVTPNSLSFPFPEVPASLRTGDTVLWLGRLEDRQKCPRQALGIFSRVHSTLPEAKMLMVGPASEEYKDVLLDDIDRLDLGGCVSLCGSTDDIQTYYRGSDVFLMTSRFEGFPLTLSESQAMGLPCVMYDMPYLTLTESGLGCVKVPFGDEVAAADALVGLLVDADERIRMGSEARANVARVLDFDYEALWRGIFGDLSEGHDEADCRADRIMWDTFLDGAMLRDRDVDACQRELAAERSRSRAAEASYEALQRSTMLKVGKMVTAPARRLKDVMRGFGKGKRRFE